MTFPYISALRHLGDLAGAVPVVLVDTREQTPLPLRRLPWRRAGLYTGDYSLAGMEEQVAIERKSIADLVACCTSGRERFERELHRLRGFWFRRLLVVGALADIEAGVYRSQVAPAAVLASLAAWEVRYGVPVVFEPDPEAAGRLVENWCYWCAREAVEAVNNILRGTCREGRDHEAVKQCG